MGPRKISSLLGLELRRLGGPAGNRSSYRLSYPGSMSCSLLELISLCILLHIIIIISRDSSVCIATRLRPGSRGLTPGRQRDFSFLHNVQTGSGDHPDCYTRGTGALSQRVKRQGRGTDQSPPSRAKFKGTYTSSGSLSGWPGQSQPMQVN
jgi:hypothetical protein